jgi:dipeptidyl aminopeptidase/acylaminoacyl peptidase
MTETAPYGSWRSPITPDVLVERVVGLSFPIAVAGTVYWLESRPADSGRQVVVRRRADGTVEDVLPAGYSARTLVHEYGGLCFAVRGETVIFSNFSDQRLYSVAPGGSPVPITDEATPRGSVRWADFVASPDGAWLAAVRERHSGDVVVNDIAAVALAGGTVRLVAGGHDFFSAPRFSPDGSRLAWLSWDHPRMPWDGTELWEAPVGPGLSLGEPRLIAGGEQESVSQPRYSPDGTLHFVSDRTGWWNLYADDGSGGRVVVAKDAEFSGPDWVFGQSTYAFLPNGAVVTVWSEGGRDRLGLVHAGVLQEIGTVYTELDGIGPRDGGIIAVAGSATEAPAVVEFDLPQGRSRVVTRSRDGVIDDGYLSAAAAIEYPTEGGLTAHALYYRPANRDFAGPSDERPPLLVLSHGGPTGAARAVLDYAVQFWTSRGIAVVDVDYGGSTGYGRAYRERLKGAWGVVDVDDCTNVARWLASQGEVDSARLAIKGGSAGGYTTLCAVTFRDAFAAGSSHYGVADVGALARDTHKFESRYLDGLIGPWPEAEAVYRERSPIFHTDKLRTPLILFQGLEDKIVPPNQAEMMAAALHDKGIPHALVLYEGEQHGFRNAENITRTAELELEFFGQVLGFEPADDIEGLQIENWHPK